MGTLLPVQLHLHVAVVDAAPDTEGAVNDALMRLTQQKLFEILKQFEVDAKRVRKADITFLAKAVAELVRSSVLQKQWADKLRQRAEAVAEKVAKVAAKGGLSDSAVQTIRREILEVGGSPGRPPAASSRAPNRRQR